MMKFHKQFTPYPAEMLADLEEHISASLPSDYRQFLLEFGGGQIEDNMFELRDKNGELLKKTWVDTFLGNDNEGLGVDLYENYITFRDRIHPDFIPIAENGGGDYLCIGIRGKDEGKIYMWRHEYEAEYPAKPSYKNMEYIADSFTQLVSNLFPGE